MPPRILVCGPASWNHLIVLDHLPEPVPHMQFAEDAWHTIGGTSAGKALHLAALGADVILCAPLGPDPEGGRIVAACEASGVRLEALGSEVTERHVNLMTRGGERVSLYVATPSRPARADVERAARLAAEAEVAVLDLSELGSLLLDRAGATSVWTDLHDYNGTSAFHEPFVRRAEVVFMNADRTDDPWQLMQSCLDRGPRVAVCTLGAEGAIALTASGERHRVGAEAAEVVDTNGAGDAFLAGFLAATLTGADVPAALRQAAVQARVAVESRHLHPVLARILDDREAMPRPRLTPRRRRGAR